MAACARGSMNPHLPRTASRWHAVHVSYSVIWHIEDMHRVPTTASCRDCKHAASTRVGVLGVGFRLRFHLRGGYERAADIGVAEEAKVLDARVAQADVLLHKANGRMRCRVRHRDHNLIGDTAVTRLQ